MTDAGSWRPPAHSRLVLAAHRLVLRSGAGRLRPAWSAAYRAAARVAAAYLVRGEAGASAYARGGLATGDVQPGLSDVDVAVVLPADPAGHGVAAERVRRRWERLRGAVPAVQLLVDWPRVYEDADLRDLVGTSALTYGLEGGDAGYFGERASLDRLRMLERPGLHATAAGWRRLTGPERRPPEPRREEDVERIAAWLELLYWWRWAFPICLDPLRPRSAGLCVKLVAEPARIWLWLAHGERVAGRDDALARAIVRLPEEEPALRAAQRLRRGLGAAPAPPLAEALPAMVRISERIAGLLDEESHARGWTEVRLAGELAGGAAALPLADWRALACPAGPDESLASRDGDPGDPAAVRAAALAPETGPYPALRSGGLLVLPAGSLLRSRLRAVKCRTSDPVSFALLDGARVARFPDAPGWSAGDTARRAVAEHRAWLHAPPGSWGGSAAGDPPALALGRLLTAGRAALFHESVASGDPELPLTVAEAGERLVARDPEARGAVEEALGAQRERARTATPPPAATVAALRRVVAGLPAYRAPAG